MNTLFDTLLDTLKKPVPLPAFLLMPVELPFVTGGKNAKKKIKKNAVGRSSASKTLQFALEGPLGRGEHTAFAINGYDLKTTADTWIFGQLRVGAYAKVKGVIVNGHERLCTSVVIKPDNGSLAKS